MGKGKIRSSDFLIMIRIDSLSELVDSINDSLGDFKWEFAYKRKECAKLGKTPNRNMFFKYENEDRDWAINEGGGTEIQYQIYMRGDYIGYGLGFNAQYVPFANNKRPIDYIKPFVDAFVYLKNNNNKQIEALEKKDFTIQRGDWDKLSNIQNDDYYLFGKTIQIDNGVISDEAYNDMINTIKGELYNLYIDIWEKKNSMEQNEMEYTEKMKIYSNLVQKNHNLILTGAPGTGKTYMAKQIAQIMIYGEPKKEMSEEEKIQFNEQCSFVQFHPSYDYTDFVEGLRPIQDDNGNVGFERKDGVFKGFCERALKNMNEKQQVVNFDEVYKMFVDDILENNNNIELKTLALKKDFIVEVNNNQNLYAIPKTEQGTKYSIKKETILKYLENGEILDWKPYVTAIGEYIRTQYKENLSEKKSDKNAIFIFIIDEINRGEISKIFGELFFSIDPGYRGKDGKVRTQYANMQTEPNEFDTALEIKDSNNYGNFFVPENVYIIGTMNDIDRSVESMDFAFRRRFAFKEITAEETQSMLDNDGAWEIDGKSFKPDDATVTKIKNRMNNLNNKIWQEKDGEKDNDKCIEGLSSAYHIGASYFLKLVNYRKDDNSYDKESFEKLWNYHLEGLLREYLRGMQNVDEKIDLLKAAYDNESDTNN